MNVVHVISSLNLGGAENFVVQLANRQVKNYKVNIVTLRQTDLDKNYKNSVHPNVNLIALNWQYKYSIKQLLKLYKVFTKLSPSVVHVHLHNPFYYIYILSYFKRRITYLHTIHSSYNNWKKVLSFTNKLRIVNNKILHVSLSKTISKEIKKAFPKLKTTTIANGIEPYSLSREKKDIHSFWEGHAIAPKKGFRFLTIGSISDNKNYKLLALSFKALAKKYPNAMCIQAGHPLDDKLTKELIEIDAPNVFLSGAISNAADLFTETDALVISSINEGMPIVALEALSMGVPIITTPVGGMRDIVDSSVGVVSQNFEVESFTKTLSDFIELSQDKKKTLAVNAKKMFDNRYNINITEKKYDTHYGLG